MVWKRWLAQYRYYYNETISLLRCFDGVENLSAEMLDKVLQQLENTPDWVKTIPGHQRQEACCEAYDAFRRAKKDNGFAKFKSVKATNQTIQFKVGNYKNGTWYCNTTKGLGFTTIDQSVPFQCEYGTELVYRRGKWFGCFPCVEETKVTGSDRVIALEDRKPYFFDWL
jgi:putative transposase